MTKYRTRWQHIELVEIERETEACVWIRGRKHNKGGGWEAYHDTGQEAKDHIIERAKMELDVAAVRLQECEEKLEKAKNAKIPEIPCTP